MKLVSLTITLVSACAALATQASKLPTSTLRKRDIASTTTDFISLLHPETLFSEFFQSKGYKFSSSAVVTSQTPDLVHLDFFGSIFTLISLFITPYDSLGYRMGCLTSPELAFAAERRIVIDVGTEYLELPSGKVRIFYV